MEKHYRVLILFLFSIAFLLRILGITYGLPDMLCSDENRQILDALGMLSQKTLIPYENSYPALHKYLLMSVYGVYYIFGYLVGSFSSPHDFAISFLVAPGDIIFISRCLSALFGFGIVIWAYTIGKRFFAPYGFWFCPLLFTFFFHLIQVSQWALGDVMMLFFAIACLYYMLFNIERPSEKSYFLSSLFLGLSISLNYKALFMGGPWLFSILISWFYLKKYRPIRTLFLFCFLPFGLSFLLFNMAWIFKFSEVYQRFRILASETQYAMSSTSLFSHNPFNYFLWFIKASITQEKGIGILSGLGIFYAFFCIKNPRYLFFTVYILSAILFWSRSSIRYLYHISPIFIVTLILGGGILNAFFNTFSFKKYKKLLLIFLSFIIIAPSLKMYYSITQKKLNPDTRILAREWIEKNIPFHSKIAMDWYELNVSLLSDIPPSFNHPLGIAFYKKYFPSDLKQKYLDSVSNRSYELTSLISTEEKDQWPAHMPQELRDKAQKIDLVKRLYSRYLTPTSIDELKQKGIQYVILSSYSYSHFLLDKDPFKTPLLNIYFIEDTLSNHLQSSTYDPTYPNSILFFLIEHNRNFYHLFLDEKDKSVKLIKEFAPSNNFGSTIKIYQIL